MSVVIPSHDRRCGFCEHPASFHDREGCGSGGCTCIASRPRRMYRSLGALGRPATDAVGLLTARWLTEAEAEE